MREAGLLIMNSLSTKVYDEFVAEEGMYEL